MSTLLPPQRHKSKDFENSGPHSRREPARDGDVDYLELCMRGYPAARRRAVLSIIPGLGQFKNGEFAKGTLFLTITLANAALVASVFAGGPLTKFLTSAATSLHRVPNFQLAEPLNGVIQSPALFIYIGLVVTFVAYAIRDAYDRGVKIIRDQQKLPKYALTLPEAASGSYLAHFAVMIGFALLVIFFITPQEPKQQVTVIELMQPEKPPAPAKKEPKKDLPKPKAEIPKPIEPKPVVKPQPVPHKVEPPKPMPIAVATPTNEPTPFTTAPAEAPPAAQPDPTPAPSTGGGSTGGVGTGGGDGGGEVDMGPWMREMQRKIKKSWFPPKGNESKRIKVTFKVSKDGSVRKVKLISSSGVSIADDAATQAISDAAPFAPLPDGVGDEIDINFTFDYNVFGAKR